jgi:hypothetical protein
VSKIKAKTAPTWLLFVNGSHPIARHAGGIDELRFVAHTKVEHRDVVSLLRSGWIDVRTDNRAVSLWLAMTGLLDALLDPDQRRSGDYYAALDAQKVWEISRDLFDLRRNPLVMREWPAWLPSLVIGGTPITRTDAANRGIRIPSTCFQARAGLDVGGRVLAEIASTFLADAYFLAMPGVERSKIRRCLVCSLFFVASSTPRKKGRPGRGARHVFCGDACRKSANREDEKGEKR